MMENKSGLQAIATDPGGLDGVRRIMSQALCAALKIAQARSASRRSRGTAFHPIPCTDSVDNFVKNPLVFRSEVAPRWACDRSMTKQAAQKALKSRLLSAMRVAIGAGLPIASNGAVCGHICAGNPHV
jgi:hypothetical protein